MALTKKERASLMRVLGYLQGVQRYLKDDAVVVGKKGPAKFATGASLVPNDSLAFEALHRCEPYALHPICKDIGSPLAYLTTAIELVSYSLDNKCGGVLGDNS